MRKKFGRANPNIFESAVVAKSGLVFIDTNKSIATWKNKHVKQTLFMLKWVPNFYFDAKLTAFTILALLDIIDLEIYRKISEFSTLAWGQRGNILIYRSFLSSFSFVNIIL